MNREELHQKFNTIFEKLNTEQQQAVNQIDGPVLVIAGPGTGKTQILSARIGKILLETDSLPDNILCLTFTDAGRIAMRKRLQEMIGADAYRVQIHTFHSFCNQIIQENVSFFKKNTLDTISEIESIDFLKKIIDDMKSDNPLKRYRGDAYYEINRLQKLFQVMKKEGWTSTYIKQKVDEYITLMPDLDGFQYLRNGPTYKKGDLKVALIKEETEKVTLLKHATDAFDEYQRMMHEHHRYDFDDMINWVNEAFEQNENILLDNQERFQYLLVDEYQDTNGSQNKLIQLLIKNVEKPNVFVVGDDDQSIYRFQGANVENILTFKNSFANMLTNIVLQTNYRSTQIILDVSKAVIENNKERLVSSDSKLVKNLIAGNELRLASNIQPELHIYASPFFEYIGITEQVYDLINNDKVAPQKIAIIYTMNKIGDEFIKFFKAKSIPFFSKKHENLFQIPLARKMLQVLKYIALESKSPYSADDLLFEILHFEQFNIPPFEIAKASVKVGDKRYEGKTSLRTYLQEWIHTKNPEQYEHKPHQGIIDISTLLEKWIQSSFNTNVLNVIEQVMIEGGFLKFAMNHQEKIWHLEVLRSLMDFLKDELHRNPDHSMFSLLEVIDLMNQQDIPISLYRTFGVDNGVNLLTAHSSKGLEFEYVFLMNATSSNWEKKAKRNSTYKIPDIVFQAKSLDSKDEKNHEENRRLFFVAMTRAENNLKISWSKVDEKLKVNEPTVYIAEIEDKVTLSKTQIEISESVASDYLEIYLLENMQPIIKQGERDFINSLLERFELSVTSLNNYLECPLKFYYNNLIRVPGGRSEASEFGSAIHHALERLFIKMQENEEQQFPMVDDCIRDFEWYMHRHREAFTPAGMKLKLEYGHKILNAIYEQNIDTWNKVAAIERKFSSVMVEGVPIKGMIDKMEFDNNNVIVIDYKTGDPNTANEKLSPPKASKPLGGNYWRQGIFYKLLIDNHTAKDYKAIKTRFQFLEPNKSNNYIFGDVIPSEDDIEVVKKQIVDTWQKIQAHDFYTGCGEEKCTWCNFVKGNNNIAELLHVSKDMEVNE